LQNEANYGKINKITHKNLMPNTISNNSLDELVFKDDLDFQTFKNILESLDHVSPKKVSREALNRFNGDFLVETWEDTFWKKYDLLLPEDLQQWELLNCILFLSQKFWLEEYTPNESIITYVKVMIAIILRNTKEEDTEAYFLWLASKYHLSSEFVQRIKNEKMILSEAKKMVRDIRGKKWDKERLWSDEDVKIWYEELSDLFWEQFDLTFFRKWMNMLRLGMRTITEAEQEAKIKYCEDNWFEKKTLNNWEIEYTKWEENIEIHLSSERLDKEERWLRDKIWIDDFKNKLEEARESWNKEIIEKQELEASRALIKVLYEYMYQFTEVRNWYQPSKMWAQKEIYCVWYALLWHAFLSELWIEHYWLVIPEHSALELVMWWKKYYFDVTAKDDLLEFDYWTEMWIYSEIVWKWWNFWNPIFSQRWEPEKILFSQICNNKWLTLYELWKYEETIAMCNKAIELNPNFASVYSNKWTTFKNLRKNKFSKLYNYASTVLKWTDSFLDISYRKEKWIIKQFIASKDFEWLRKYLIEQEKKEK